MPKKKITINDIAKEAGVSRALVSFILSNEAKGEKIYRVSDGTTRKVLDIIRKYDYHPSDSARRLRSGESGIIGVILSDISNYQQKACHRDCLTQQDTHRSNPIAWPCLF